MVMSNAHTVFFVGKPASGKGTQAELLSKKTGWSVISTSGGLRELVAQGGALSDKLKETMDAGYLTPSWLAAYANLKALFALPESGDVIFDGAHRSIDEARTVVEAVQWLGRGLHIIHLVVPDEEVRARIALRRETEGRADDTPEAVEKRIQAYYELTDKSIAFLRTEGLLVEINGVGAREAIAAEIDAALGIA